jgi:hypothetical protein
MTPAIRCLVLLTACSALNACSDVEFKSATKGPSTKLEARPEEMPKPEQPKPEVTLMPQQDLTAQAPATPPSIADLKVTPKAEELSVKSEDEHPQPKEVDYERELDPSEVKVSRFLLATDVKGREPLGETDVFNTDTKKIFAFVELTNDKEPYAFRVHWEKSGEPASHYGVKLDVPTAPRFRTWSWTAIKREPGTYRAVLRTLTGEEITSREFVIESGEDHDEL